MIQIIRNLLVFALALPCSLMPYQATKQGVTLEAQDLTNIPLGNLFRPEDGDRQDMASIDVNKKLNLCLIGISIKNESSIAYELDPMLMSPYAHQEYNKLSSNLSGQDNKLWKLKLKGLTAAYLGGFFGVSLAGFMIKFDPTDTTEKIAYGLFTATAGLCSTALYYGVKAYNRSTVLKKDRKEWIHLFAIGKEPLVIEPGETVKKVILLDRAVYDSKSFIVSLFDQDRSSGAVVSFNVPLNNGLDWK